MIEQKPPCLKQPGYTITLDQGFCMDQLDIFFKFFIQFRLRWFNATLIAISSTKLLLISQPSIQLYFSRKQQVLLMKINFDKFPIQKHITEPKNNNKNAIKIQIQTPLYEQFIRQLSAQESESQIFTINSLMGWPREMKTFFTKEISKQLKQSSSSSSIKVQSPAYFMERTCSYNQIVKKINKKEQVINKSNVTKKPKDDKQNKFNAKLQKVFNYKKHKCKEEDEIETDAKKTLNDMKQLTYRPKLVSSTTNRKVVEHKKMKTQNLFVEENSSVFESLYNEAKQRKAKDLLKVVQKQQEYVEQKPKINHNYFKNNPQSTYISIYNRLQSIMDAKQTKRREQQKYDLTQMRELFKPDLHLSQQSFKLLSKSLVKQTQQKQHAQKQKQKKKQRQKIEKEKLKQEKKMIEVEKVNSKQLQLLLSKNLFTSRAQINRQNLLDVKTIEHFTQIFYSQSSTDTKSENPLTKEQFMILQNFLKYVEELESKNYQTQTTISKTSLVSQQKQFILSKQEFQQKFRKYYEKLSLYDRQILRKHILNDNKNKNVPKLKNNRQKFKPRINARSTSLDNIAEGHSKHIYYV